MKIFIQVSDKRVVGWGSSKGNEKDIEIDVPANHEVLRNPFIFLYDNNVLTKNDAYQQQLLKEKEEQDSKPTTEQQLELIQKALDDIVLGVL